MFSFFLETCQGKNIWKLTSRKQNNALMTAVDHLQHNTMNFVSAHVCLVGLMVRVIGWISFFHVDQVVIQNFLKAVEPKCELLSESDGSIYRPCMWPSAAGLVIGEVMLARGHDHRRQGACDNWFRKDTWNNCLKTYESFSNCCLTEKMSVGKEYNRMRRSNRKRISIVSSQHCWPKTCLLCKSARQRDEEVQVHASTF